MTRTLTLRSASTATLAHRRCPWRRALAANTRSISGGSGAPRPAKVQSDYLTPTPSRLLGGLLADLVSDGAAAAKSGPGFALPQGHHLVYWALATPASRLAADGADADHVPPGGGVAAGARRLWAGGDVRFRPGWQRRLRLDGREAWCREGVQTAPRPGRGGVAVVHVRRRYGLRAVSSADDYDDDAEAPAWEIDERRTLVFTPPRHRPATPPPSPRPTSPTTTRRTPLRPASSAHLFHFSALTYNAHSIHLRAGNGDLLVHGPLTLALMLRALPRQATRLVYRNHAPLYADAPWTLCCDASRDPCDVWIEGPDGAVAVSGTACLEPLGGDCRR